MNTIIRDPDALAKPDRPYTFAIVLIAVALRILVLVIVTTQFGPEWIYSRGVEMGLLAQSILKGHGLGSPFGGSTGPTAFIAPAYPILVAAIFHCFGIYSRASAIVIMVFQVMLNLITVWLIMRIALKLFGVRAANIAGLFWGCSLPLLWMPTIFWETSISTCLMAGLILLALNSMDCTSMSRWICIGIYCGIAGLVNPALIPATLSVFAWVAYQSIRTVRLPPLVGLVACIVVFAPWPIRNAYVFHAFIPTRTTVGFELWMGNRPGASGYLEESLFPMFNPQELAEYKSKGEIAYTNDKTLSAKQSIKAYPLQFLRLTTLRFIRFWTGTGTRGGSAFFPFHALLSTTLGIVGLAILFKSHGKARALLFLLPLIVFPLPYYITHAEFRYRLVVDPILAILSAFSLTEVLQYCKDQTTSRPNIAIETLSPSNTISTT